jgi:RimJ/RimL family protein N-acetyltransferase
VPWIAPVTLSGNNVTLEPLSKKHHDALVEAASDGQLWNLWYTNVPDPGGMMSEIERRLDLQGRGSMLPFTVIENATGRAAGMTTYMNIDADNRRVEIGSTWLRQGVQRTAVNTECKLLLLSHAFDTLGCIAVELRTSAANAQSRRAIERLGAKLDGILRSAGLHKNGTVRDTVVYSIIAAEWPAVRFALSRLA